MPTSAVHGTPTRGLLFGAVLAFWFALPLSGCNNDKLPLPELAPEQSQALEAHLNAQRLPAADYVIAQFEDHDVVFLGEYHRIRRDVVFVQELIPRLHEAGIHLLGLEFARWRDQPLIDSLLTAADYDESLARQIFWNEWPWWGYREYVDLLHAAWRLNRQLPADAPPLRILGLNAEKDWSHVRTPADRSDPAIMRRVFPEGDADSVMAATVLREVVARGERALIYSGINHAYTRFGQPFFDDESGAPAGRNRGRMGNRVHARLGDRCCTIFLHSPWPPAGGYGQPYVYPADGLIDAFFADHPPPPGGLGFDTRGTPFGALPGRTSLWGRADGAFVVADYCDGWVFLGPLSACRGVSAIEDWFAAENRREAILQVSNPDPRVKDLDRSVEDLRSSLVATTRIERQFARFH